MIGALPPILAAVALWILLGRARSSMPVSANAERRSTSGYLVNCARC